MSLDAVRSVDRARAAELARSGDYDGAVRLLDDLGRTDVSTLDLLARVHAQRGDMAAARSAWEAALALDPSDASALAGIKLLSEITEGKRRSRPLPVLVAGSVVVAVAAAAVLVSIYLPRGEELPTAQPTPPPTSLVAPTSAVPDPRPALMASLASADVRVAPHGDGVQVVFLRGMFLPDSTSLSPEGRRQLVSWGQQLRGRNVRVTVFGHGVVVPGEPASGGSVTAVERATAAVEVLTEVAELPATAFVVRSADQADAPHVGADPALNRTVSLQIDFR